MAEASIFGLASQILSKIDYPPFREAFKSVAGSTSELEGLKKPIGEIRPYLLDAEQREEESSGKLKKWIKTVREALRDVDDLFEGVAANDPRGKGKTTHWRKVLLPSFSSIIPTNPTVKIAADIRERLDGASEKRETFSLIPQEEEPTYGTSGEHVQRSILDPKEGYIREDDKKVILGFLRDETVSLVIILGRRGIGKTTIAQLVCNNEMVQDRFKETWWASMSNAFDEKEVYERILRAMIGKSSYNLTSTQLKTKIRGYMFSVKRFLIVLDDVWAQDFDRWMRIRKLVKIVPKGSMIMVTSRQPLNKRTVVGLAIKTHGLHKLSDHDSKKLLEWFPVSEIGEKTLEACEHVPLAIKILASLCYMNRDSLTIEHLSKIESRLDRQKALLKFSYQHLHSNLKHCLAYCSLFPEDYIIHKRVLIHLWIAQGFVRKDAGDQLVEEVGDLYFKELLTRSFFEEPREDELGEIYCCKMHDLVHEVAGEVAGKGSIMLTKKEGTSEEGNQSGGHIRQVSVGYEVDASWKIPSWLLSEGRVRSILFMAGGTLNPVIFDQLLAKFRLLRALSLERLNLKKVPSSIRELRLLKYLNLSHNKFRHLPDSITRLPNLLTLDISGCSELVLLPKTFSRLINLRHLLNSECHSLRHMPPGIGSMTALLKLGCFRVRKVADDAECSGINVLKKLKLKELAVRFDHDWKEDAELDWHPETLVTLHIEYYQGGVLPSLPSNLVELHLYNCKKVEDVSTLRELQNLKNLVLFWMDKLEHVTTDQDAETSSSFSSLEKLILKRLRKFKGWSQKENHDDQPLLSSLSFLKVEECPELKRMPPSTSLKTVSLRSIEAGLVEELSAAAAAASLEELTVDDCDGLGCFRGNALTSLRRLKLLNCSHLREVDLPPGLKREEVETRGCPQLKDGGVLGYRDGEMEPRIQVYGESVQSEPV